MRSLPSTVEQIKGIVDNYVALGIFFGAQQAEARSAGFIYCNYLPIQDGSCSAYRFRNRLQRRELRCETFLIPRYELDLGHSSTKQMARKPSHFGSNNQSGFENGYLTSVGSIGSTIKGLPDR